MSDGYTIIERRGDKIKMTRYANGGTQVLEKIRRTKSGTTNGSTGYWQLSRSNGFVGTKADLQKALKADALRGVQIDYVPHLQSVDRRGRKVYAWKAAFADKRQKNNWLRSHGRVDQDAGYGEPCPGDFKGKFSHEFGDNR